jgi:hypothetical protein
MRHPDLEAPQMAGMNAVADLLAWFGWYVIPFIIILSLIVAVHELGHYFVGRWCGVKIDAFSLGFGPELFARHPVADWRAAAWRVCQVSRRRQRRERRQRRQHQSHG